MVITPRPRQARSLCHCAPLLQAKVGLCLLHGMSPAPPFLVREDSKDLWETYEEVTRHIQTSCRSISASVQW